MTRRAIFVHALAGNDAALAALIANAKKVFEQGDYRLNFFSVHHNNDELGNSCKNQAKTMPIHVVFHPSCTTSQINGMKTFLKTAASKIKQYSYELAVLGNLESVSKEIEQNMREKKIPVNTGNKKGKQYRKYDRAA